MSLDDAIREGVDFHKRNDLLGALTTAQDAGRRFGKHLDRCTVCYPCQYGTIEHQARCLLGRTLDEAFHNAIQYARQALAALLERPGRKAFLPHPIDIQLEAAKSFKDGSAVAGPQATPHHYVLRCPDGQEATHKRHPNYYSSGYTHRKQAVSSGAALDAVEADHKLHDEVSLHQNRHERYEDEEGSGFLRVRTTLRDCYGPHTVALVPITGEKAMYGEPETGDRKVDVKEGMTLPIQHLGNTIIGGGNPDGRMSTASELKAAEVKGRRAELKAAEVKGRRDELDRMDIWDNRFPLEEFLNGRWHDIRKEEEADELAATVRNIETSEQPLKIDVENGRLIISIGVYNLARSVLAGEYFQSMTDDKDSPKIPDPTAFAKDLAIEMMNEDDEGSTLFHRLFDVASEDAVENGCTSVYVPSDSENP